MPVPGFCNVVWVSAHHLAVCLAVQKAVTGQIRLRGALLPS